MTQSTKDDSPESGLDANQLRELRQLLLDARVSLTLRRSGQLRARTGLISEVEDEGDSAARAGDEDRLVQLAETEHDKLAEIDHALSKFETGDYGLDEETEEPIGFARLRLIPWARYSATTQEALERRG
jgi:DnaK suppressor protein